MPNEPALDTTESGTRPIVEWLAAAHGATTAADVPVLRQHLETLRAAQLPPTRRMQLLDFLYDHAVRVVDLLLPAMRHISLPVSRKSRQEIRSIQDVLENLCRDYLALLRSEVHSPGEAFLRAPEAPLWRAIHCLSLHLMTSHLAGSPAEVGVWRMLHDAYALAGRYQVEEKKIPRQERTVQELYLSSVLLGCSQPTSFTTEELEFIGEYVAVCGDAVTLSRQALAGRQGLFWIDPQRDVPAQALSRRSPPPETDVWFFAGDLAAQRAKDHLEALESGCSANQLDLPPFAETPAGKGVLRRLVERWGQPPKRKFPRRRHATRAKLCAGLHELWRLLETSGNAPVALSEWMIINESPQGWAMMHLSGRTDHLRVGDLVAICLEEESVGSEPVWHVCMVRWALSENPEHIEVGIQILAPSAAAAVFALSGCAPDESARGKALLLPRIPPLWPTEALAVRTGLLKGVDQRLTLVVGENNVVVRELRITGVCEQTSNVEVFNVESVEKR